MQDMFGAFSEEIARTAFQKTLQGGCDTCFLVNHEGVSMARTKPGTMKLSSDNKGLHVDARLNLDRPDVRIVRAAVADGDLDEMSFAFRVTRQEWDPEYTHRRIQEVNMHQGDVSVVNFGASPHTSGVTLTTLSRKRKGSTVTTVVPNYVPSARAALDRYRRKHADAI
jgi:hypothetical protein